MGNCCNRSTAVFASFVKPNFITLRSLHKARQPRDEPTAFASPNVGTTQQASTTTEAGLHIADRSMSKPGTTQATGKCSQVHPDKLSSPNLNSSSIIAAPSVFFQAVSRPLNSLFKVLCNFPSRYLFAIGLVSVFSLTRSSPRIWAALPSNPTLHTHLSISPTRYGPCTLYGRVLRSGRLSSRTVKTSVIVTLHFVQPLSRTIQRWAFPCSLAVTEGILVSFFSSAYLYA